MHPCEQAYNMFRPRGYARAKDYHRYLKRGRNRWIRRRAKELLHIGEEPPSKVGYKGYEW